MIDIPNDRLARIRVKATGQVVEVVPAVAVKSLVSAPMLALSPRVPPERMMPLVMATLSTRVPVLVTVMALPPPWAVTPESRTVPALTVSPKFTLSPEPLRVRVPLPFLVRVKPPRLETLPDRVRLDETVRVAGTGSPATCRYCVSALI